MKKKKTANEAEGEGRDGGVKREEGWGLCQSLEGMFLVL